MPAQDDSPADLARAAAGWRQGLRCPGRPDEYEAKQLLAAAGIAVRPAGVRLVDRETPAPPAAPGPYAAKVCSPDILHKTERAGVRLHLSAAALPAAVADLRRRFGHAPVLVEQQLAFRRAGADRGVPWWTRCSVRP